MLIHLLVEIRHEDQTNSLIIAEDEGEVRAL